jgi:tetratricopeptide (TPR) repeat protein
MSRRCILLLALVAGLIAQQVPDSTKPVPAKQDSKAAEQEQAPPEEDESLIPKEYSFNPLQASKELKIGNYYFKKGNYRAASQRFQEATKWDNNNAEAYLRLGEAREKQHDKKAAAAAYAKYLEVASDSKDAPEVKKRLEKLK